MFNLANIKIIETCLAVTKTDRPLRLHIKGRSQSDIYHTRVQKKWVKRFGYYSEPAMYQLQQTIYIHPALMHKIK